MPEHKPQRIQVTFDKHELRVRAPKFTYREARRHSGSFYNALVQELREDGCLTSAKYFEQFAAKETELYDNSVIRDRVIDHPKLLMSLYDNCKMAERSALLEQCEGVAVTFNLLYQVMCLLEHPQYAVKFNWLLKEVYEVIVKICDKLGPGKNNVDKPISKIYLKYANHLSTDIENLPTALLYYEKALAMVQTNKWISDAISSDTHTYSYLHTIVIHNYADALLQFGKTIASSNYLQAIALGHKALCVLTQVGQQCCNMQHFANANLHLAEFNIEGEDYKMAYKLLTDVGEAMAKISKQHYEKLALRLNLDKGICYTHLNQNEKAMECLRQALILSQNLKIKSSEAQAYMHIGKLYLLEGAKQRVLAKSSLLNSKKLYEQLGDMQNRKKNIYLIAQVMSATVFPLFLDIMKKSQKYCDFFYLRRWKNQLNPFWAGQYLRDDATAHDPILCLMEEFETKKKIKDLFKI